MYKACLNVLADIGRSRVPMAWQSQLLCAEAPHSNSTINYEKLDSLLLPKPHRSNQEYFPHCTCYTRNRHLLCIGRRPPTSRLQSLAKCYSRKGILSGPRLSSHSLF